MIIPTVIATRIPVFRGEIEAEDSTEERGKNSAFMLTLGLVLIILVPIFKTVTHLPPYIGMMLSLGLMSLVAEILTNRENLRCQKWTTIAMGMVLHLKP